MSNMSGNTPENADRKRIVDRMNVLVEEYRSLLTLLVNNFLDENRRATNPPPPATPVAEPEGAAMSTCRKCGRTGPAVDKFTSLRTGLCAECSVMP